MEQSLKPLELRLPTVLTESKTKFWTRKEFWKDGNPVAVDEWMESMLGMRPSPAQLEILWAIVGKDPYEWETTFKEYVIAIGQGGGKNKYIIAPAIGYMAYKIANMTDPWYYFSRLTGQQLDFSKKFEMSNSSMVTETQAKNVHFANMQMIIERCRTKSNEQWFAKYAGMDLRRAFGDIKTKEIRIPTLPLCGEIILHSLDSSYTAFEGLELIAGILDEPSREDTAAGYSNADKLWKGITGNVGTRFPKKVGKAIAFSYLNNSEYDYTFNLLKRAEEEEKLAKEDRIMFSVRLASWDTNPTISKDDADIRAAYRTDPSDARARYEGIKGTSKEGFYQPHPEKIRECFYFGKSPVQYHWKVTDRVITNPETQQKEIKHYTGIDITTIEGDSRVRGWAYDPAVSFDSFILKGGYIETMDEMKESLFIENRQEIVVVNKRPIIDIVIVWQPQENLTVDYINIGEVFGVLLDKFPNSRFGNSDKYNSEKLSQEIIARGVSSKTYNFQNKQQMRLYKKLRWMLWSHIPQILYDQDHEIRRRGIVKKVGEWNALEHEQLLQINANKVDHPVSGGKDFSDVDAILTNDLVMLDVKGGFAATGLQTMTDGKILALAEKYMIERQRLRNAQIPESKHAATIGQILKISTADAQKLKEYVDETFQNV